MQPAAPLLMIPFREVRHDLPDDVLHYETMNVRGRLHHWTIPAHRHEGLHQFQLLLRGSAQCTLDGEPHALDAPVALMVPPGVVHGFVYARDSTGHQVTVPSAALRSLLVQNPALLAQLERPLLVPAPALGEDVATCEQLFLRLAEEFDHTQPGRTEALQGHALLLALWFLRRENGTPTRRRQQALRDTLVQRYRALLEQQFRSAPSVAMLARKLGVTADHLSRICRATTGTSALDLLHERLLLEARRLLAYTPATVVDIAHELGFEDPAYFSRFFTKLAGQSPTTYRAAIAQGIGLPPDRK